MLDDLLKVCKDALSTLYKLVLPQRAVITTMSDLAKASRGSSVFERAVWEGMLTFLFNTDFTNDLVDAVNQISHAVPMFARPVRKCHLVLLECLPDIASLSAHREIN